MMTPLIRASARRVFITILVLLAIPSGIERVRAQGGGTINVANGDVAGLIAAINTLNANGGGTITLAPGGTYLPAAATDWWYGPNAFPAISSPIIIVGNGATIQRSTLAPNFRFFYVAGGFTTLSAGDLTLRDLTLVGGLARGGNGGTGAMGGGGAAGLGGAIFNQGTTKLITVTLAQNTAQGGNGGCCGGGAAGGGGLGGDGATTTPYSQENAGGGGGFRYNGTRGSFYYDASLPNYGHGTTAGGGFTGSEGGYYPGSYPDGTSPFGGNGGVGGGNTGAGGGGGGGFVPGANGGNASFSTCTYSFGWSCPGGAGALGGGRAGRGLGGTNISGLGGGGFGGGGGGSDYEGAGAGGGGVGGGGGGGWLSAGAGGWGGGGGGGYEAAPGGFAGGGGGGSNSSGGGGWAAGNGGGGHGGGGAGLGGAIFNHKGTLTVVSTTAASNLARGGAGALVGSGFGGVIFNLNGYVTVASLAPSGNTAVNGADANTGGTVLYNLSHNDGRTIPADVPTSTATLINMPALDTTQLVNNQVHGTATVTTATAPELTPSVTSLVFASQALNTPSAAQRITIANTGSNTLNINSIVASGDFTRTTTCATLAQGQSCYVDVTFLPTAGLLRTGALVVGSNALDSPRTIALSGRGGFPGVSLSPTSLSFANQLIKTASASQRVVLTNSGQDTLNVSAIAMSGQYTNVNTCSAIAPGATCNIDVKFTPTTRGNQPGMVSITDDASGTPHLVSLTGFAIGPVVSLSTTSLGYNTPLLTNEIKPVVLTNVGDAPVTVSAIATAAPFSQTHNCGSVPINGSCTINVKFTPASTSTVSGVLTITDNGEDSPQTVTLGGTGIAPSASASPAALNFADQTAGFASAAQTVTVTNAGPGPLTAGPITIGGDFQQTNNCAQVASGASCVVNVTFKPTAAGPRAGALTIGTNATQGVLSVSLAGTGVQPIANLSTPSLSFGSLRTGATTAPQQVVIRNDGPVQMLVTSVSLDVTDYVQQNTCTATMAVGQTCTVSVSFAPKAIGSRPGKLTVVANAASALIVDLSGTGTTPVVTSATITSSANPATWGDTITLTAHLTTTPSAVPTGSVSFSDGALALGTAAIDGAGTASLTISSLAPGSHSIYANYAGDALFTPVSLYATFPVTTALNSFYPSEMVTGDFNGDGSVDLAVLGRNGSTFAWEIAVVSGSTVTRMSLSYLYGGGAHFLVAGDFNGDGKTDVAYTDSYYPFVYMHSGSDNGLNYFSSTLPVGGDYNQSIYALTAGDLNGDGKADLVATLYGTHYYALSGGYFSFSASFGSGLPPYGFQTLVADLNQDGKGDFLVPGSNNDIAVAMSAGSSWTIGSIPAGGGVSRFAAGDIDSDGRNDLIRVSGTEASFIRNLGSGTFAAPVTFSLGAYANYLRIADMNSDGKPDLVVSLGSTIATFVGDGTGQFTNVGAYTVGSMNGMEVARVRAGLPASVFVLRQSPSQTLRLRPNSLGVLEAADDVGGGFAQTILRPTVTPAVTVNGKPYDGTKAATIASRALTGVIGSDDVTLTGGTATFADAAASTNKTVTITGLALAGADASKYLLASSTLTVSADISAVTLTPLVTVSNKVYDGTTTATIATRTVTGVIGSEAVSLSGGTATFDTPNAGPGKSVSIDGLWLGGATVGNYLIGPLGAVTADITAATVNGSVTVADKPYDGTTAATIATRSLSGVIGNDDVALTGGTAAFADTGVGTSKPVSITGLSINGAAADNYKLAASALSANADIISAGLTPIVTIAGKAYDTTTTAAIVSRTLDGVVSGDDVQLVGGTATFADAAVGSGKTVTVTGLTLTGADASEYQLSSTTLTLSADISAVTLTPVVTVSDKVYDGTTPATIATRSLIGVIGSDAVALSGGTAAFDTPNAGPGKPVSIDGLTLDGASAGNYLLGSVGAVAADITAATVNGSATVENKTYDGATTATIATRSLSGVIGNDDVALTGGAAAFADAAVGSNKPVSVTGVSISGGAAGNYELASATLSTTAGITRAALTPIVTAASKVYDATTAAAIVGRTLTGVVGGDDVVLVGGTATFANSNVGTSKTVTVMGLSLSGGAIDNYSLSSTTATTAADITSAPLSITTLNASRMYGAATPLLSGVVSGVQAGDAITGSWSTTAIATTAAGVYPITPAFVDPNNRLGNYNVTSTAGSLTISNPVPSLSEIMPNVASAGSAPVTIALTGASFVPQSEVRWNGVAIATVYGSATGLTATIPAAKLTAATVGYLTVFNATPGGGTTSSQAFLVSDSGVPVAGVDTASASGGTATATTGGTGAGTPGSVSATFTGTGTVSVAQYSGNPSHVSGAFRSANSYFDVYVAPGSVLTSLTVVNCNLKGGNLVFWFDGSSWVRVSNQTYDRNTGCTTLHFDTTTVPTVAELIATYFAIALDFTPPVSTASATAGAAPYAFGAWTSQNVAVQLSSADAADGTGLASFTYGATGASSIGPVTSATGSAALTIAAEGVTTISFHGVDVSGNEEAAQTRVVRVDRTAPVVSGAATPNQLWPPNGNLVAVVISGNASDAGAGLASVTYQVADEYGQVQPSGVATVQPSGAYSFTINLPAQRNGTDQDGRIFTVTVSGVDAAGNVRTTATQVIVPHDQGK